MNRFDETQPSGEGDESIGFDPDGA